MFGEDSPYFAVAMLFITSRTRAVRAGTPDHTEPVYENMPPPLPMRVLHSPQLPKNGAAGNPAATTMNPLAFADTYSADGSEEASARTPSASPACTLLHRTLISKPLTQPSGKPSTAGSPPAVP
jgi:hypothetical protein